MIRGAAWPLATLVLLAMAGCSGTAAGRGPPVERLVAASVQPQGKGPFPAVILLHGCGGYQGAAASALRAHADYLADHGYAALILDSFGPRGLNGGGMCSPARLAEARAFRLRDLFAAYRYLAGRPFADADNLYALGQSNGGSVALLAAAGARAHGLPGDERFRAIVAYYPWCGAMPETIVTPVLVFAAGRDAWVDPRDCLGLEGAELGAPLETVLYRDAHHSFDLDIDYQRFRGRAVGGDPRATRDSRERMLRFLDANRSP